MMFELEEIIMAMTVILLGGGCSPRVSGSNLEAIANWENYAFVFRAVRFPLTQDFVDIVLIGNTPTLP